MDMEKDGEEGDTEERIDDLEDALDELKAEFEKMMGDKDGEEEKEEESLEPIANDTEAVEMPVEGKKDMKDKETMKEYKIQKSADNKDGSDNKKSPVTDAGSKMPKGGDNIAKGSAEEKGRPAPTAQKMSDFENTGGKDKSTSFKKEMKADHKDGADNTKSPVATK